MTGRFRFSKKTINVFKKFFKKKNYLTKSEIIWLQKKTGKTKKQIYDWFRHSRNKNIRRVVPLKIMKKRLLKKESKLPPKKRKIQFYHILVNKKSSL